MLQAMWYFPFVLTKTLGSFHWQSAAHGEKCEMFIFHAPEYQNGQDYVVVIFR